MGTRRQHNGGARLCRDETGGAGSMATAAPCSNSLQRPPHAPPAPLEDGRFRRAGLAVALLPPPVSQQVPLYVLQREGRPRGLQPLPHGLGLGHLQAAHRCQRRLIIPLHPGRRGGEAGTQCVKGRRRQAAVGAIEPPHAALTRASSAGRLPAWRAPRRPPSLQATLRAGVGALRRPARTAPPAAPPRKLVRARADRRSSKDKSRSGGRAGVWGAGPGWPLPQP